MTPPTIETENLILRPFQADDAEDYSTAVLSNAVTAQALPTGKPVPPQRARSIIAGYEDHWDEFGYGLLAVIHREDDMLIGHCGLQKLGDTDNVELTYAIKQPYVAGDLPLEATYACLRYAFGTLHLEEVFAVILPENGIARRIYTRLGMRPGPTLHVYNHHVPSYKIFHGDFLPDNSPYHVRGANSP